MTSLTSRLSTTTRHQRDYSPVSWTEYFDEAHDICIEQTSTSGEVEHSNGKNDNSPQGTNSFRVYLKNFTQPPYAPKRSPGQRLDAARVELSDAQLKELSQVPTLVALHGGGYSALTWAQFTRHIEQLCRCRVLAIDLRSHGDTRTTNDTQMDINTLVEDVFAVTHAVHQQVCGFAQTPKVILIGHSMGGAIAVKCATKCTDSLPSLAGFVIIDVVEGTAKDALPLMMSVIKTRPIRFPTLKNAIEWSCRSGMAKNIEAARVSMPGNLVNIATGHLSIHDVSPAPSADVGDVNAPLTSSLKRHKFHIGVDQLIGQSLPNALLPRGPLPSRVSALRGASSGLPPLPTVAAASSEEQPPAGQQVITMSSNNMIEEEEEEEAETEEGTEMEPAAKYRKPPAIDTTGHGWRTNLAKTQPFWGGWFDGLSQQMLDAPVQAKFLLLAGIDRLDKTLTIGQMQGKFMMKVLPKCGHAVHEDVPEQVAQAIGDFLVRNKFASPIV